MSTRADPVGRQVRHTIPPVLGLKNSSRSLDPHSAHSASDGAYPAMASAQILDSYLLRARTLVAFTQRTKRSDEEQVVLDGRFTLFADQSVCRLEHRVACRVPRIVAHERFSERVPAHHLGDDVEAPADDELEVDVAERLQPGAELRGGAPDAPRHRTYLAVAAREQRDDPVGLAERVRAEDDGLIVVRRHGSLPRSPPLSLVTGDPAGSPRDRRSVRGCLSLIHI